MSIASEITRLQNAKASLKTSINAKTDSNHQISNETLEDYSTFVDSISGGGTDLNDYFENTISAGELKSSNGLYLAGWERTIKSIKPSYTVSGTSAYYMFYHYPLSTLPIIDTSNVTNMSYMFYNMSTASIDISNLNTRAATNMSNMFGNSYNLNEIIFGDNFDTTNVTNMANMFNLTALTSLNLSKFKTSKVTNMEQMFRGFKGTTLNLSTFNFSKVTNMQNMFGACVNLQAITFPAVFDTSKVTWMAYAFSSCTSVQSLPLFDCSAVTSINNLFKYGSATDFAITTLGGFNNLGKGYLTSRSANYSSYTLDLSVCNNLTEQSLINVLNGLYDIATKGCNTQSCILGATNLAKLTSSAGQQALSDAQTKGWTIS